jgi:hypothetical protein
MLSGTRCIGGVVDRIVAGGFIVCNDYGWTGYRPQKDSADAFMRLRGLSVLSLPTAQWHVVMR